MSTLAVNKTFAAVLVTGIAFMGATIIADVLVSPTKLAKPVLAVEALAPAGKAAAGAGPQAEPPVAVLLASSSPEAGEAGVKKAGCVACHSFNEGGKAGIGPNLYGVVGAPHGHMEGYAYSAALKGKAGPWTFDELNEWLKKPSAYAPGTKMTYAGLADPKARADILNYLHTLAATPVALPAAPKQSAQAAVAATAGSPPAVTGGEPPVETLLASADAAAGEAQTKKAGCVACHSFAEGGKAGIGPNLYGVVGAPHGHMEGYAYSTALKSKQGSWTFAELNDWLKKPSAYAPGTKMTYAGLADPTARANVIAYLRTLSPNPEPLPAAK